VAVTVTRTKTDMIGTPGSPASVAAAATNTSAALDHTSPAGVVDASVMLELIAGASAPTTAVTVRFQVSEDGTNYAQDGPDVSLTMANSTTYDFRYDPPPAAAKSRVVVVNGATNAITAWCQGSTLAVS
jgi:hypothetical protein